MRKFTLLFALLFSLAITSKAQVLLSENFDAYALGGNTTSTGTTAPDGTDVYAAIPPTNVANFPTGTKVYQAGGMAKLGTSSLTGSMTSKVLDLSQGNGNFTVSFDVKGWTTIEGPIVVSVTGLASQEVTYTAVMSGSPENKTVTFTGGQTNSTVTIATKAKRAYIDNVVISAIGASTPVLTVTPSELTFSSNINVPTSAQGVTVSGSNLGTAPTYSITGTDAASFSATGTLTVSGGIINLTFNSASGGVKSATLSIVGGGLTKAVALIGNAIDPSNPYNLDDSAPLNALKESFGDGTATTLPANWKNVSLQGNKEWFVTKFGTPANNYAQMSAYNGTGVHQTLLISPAINLNAVDKANVKFDWKSGYTKDATLKVYVMSKDGTKTEVKSINDNANPSGFGETFNTETLNLTAYSGVKFLVFEYNGEGPSTQTTTYQVDNVVAASTSGVSNTSLQQLNLWTSAGKINFNAAAGEMVEVYNTLGQRLYNAAATDGQNEVPVAVRGVAIVKVGNRVGKVIL